MSIPQPGMSGFSSLYRARDHVYDDRLDALITAQYEV